MEKYRVDNIYVIECVDKNETQNKSAKSLYDDIISKIKYKEPNIETEYYSIDSKEQFIRILTGIIDKNIKDRTVLIHFYLHGSEEGLVANDDIISWKEIKDITREINIKTNNKLFLILANCYGSFFETELDLTKKAPFNSIISSKYEEKVDGIYSFFEKFYNSLVMQDNNVVKAYLEAKGDDGFFFKNTNALVDALFEIKGYPKEYIPITFKEYLFD
ncbi:hypothetical protein [Capnocytophaga leadbetteri]